MSSVTESAFEGKLRQIDEHKRERKARQLDRAAKFVIWGATDLVAVTALGLGAWSNQVVAHWLGIPGKAGWAAALVIDGIWLVSLAIVQLHRREPWRALSAYQATLAMVGLSAVTNFAHGLLRFGSTWRGVMAGLAFALLPVGLKWLVSVSTKNGMGQLLKAPDARSRIKQAGQISAELDLEQLLNSVRNRADPQVPPSNPEVQLEREPEPVVQNWVSPSNQRAELPKGPEVPKAEPVAISDRQARIDDLARRYAERGGQLSNVTFSELSEWYGIPSTKKSTLSMLRRAGHQAYLDGVSTGQYL